MYINSVKVAVRAHTPDGNKDFGFLFEFQEGLNVLTGDNSSGKSTVLSCIYYCLGLEQLIGSKGVNALSPALHQALMSDGYSCNIYESECFLEFTDKAGKKWSLNRVVKDGETVGSNEIIIEANGEKMSKFIHSPRDHSRNGFFKWFAEVNELDIFDVESTSGLSAKPLYMQNVFTLCFIEQTKGWSDFFSMMPPFGIKDPKQKVVEYCLGLNSLAVNMQLDAIKVGKDSIVEKWREQIKELDLRAQNLNLYLSPIDKLKPKTKRQIEKIYFFK
ncbi:ATP-binding protein [Marinobacter manganoxydans]|uniref:ATP-binding protein n=1 Tax=Marinobacter manganoxydans TaxID=1150997 RepID=UPI0005877505|nr:ATP-binding protein [Marinobacter manganoxydans]